MEFGEAEENHGKPQYNNHSVGRQNNRIRFPMSDNVKDSLKYHSSKDTVPFVGAKRFLMSLRDLTLYCHVHRLQSIA